jgi:hypothetical protein
VNGGFGDATFALEARVADDSLLVVVRDSGSRVVTPRRGKACIGRGLALMRQVAANVGVLARHARGDVLTTGVGVPRSVGRQGRDPPSATPARPAR